MEVQGIILTQLDTDRIQEAIGLPASLENLAEECSELAHAALKLSRVLRKENPTPVTLEEARNALVEETMDLMVCIDVCRIPYSLKYYQEKVDRALMRIDKEKKEKEKHNLYNESKKALEKYGQNFKNAE